MQKRSLIISSLLLLALASAPSRPAIAAKPRDESLQNVCERLMNAKRSLYYLSARSYKMTFQLRAIYTREEAMFFCLGLGNHSHLDYRIDSIRFYIADERPAGKSPAGNKPLVPLCVYGNTRMIRGKTKEYCVFALPRFTLAEKKLLVIDVSERNGGRRLRLLADNFLLVRARLI